jgi:hypothetical protein
MRASGRIGTKPALSRGLTDAEQTMGSKASNFFQSDRPESGGADKDMQREKSGLLELDKERFAAEQQKRDERRRYEDREEEGHQK